MEGTTQRRDDGARLGLTRRDLLKRGAVGGALVWSVPIVTSLGLSAASAQTASCTTAPSAGLLFYSLSSDTSTVYCVKIDTNGQVSGLAPGSSGNDGNIADQIAAQGKFAYVAGDPSLFTGVSGSGFLSLSWTTSLSMINPWVLNGTPKLDGAIHSQGLYAYPVTGFAAAGGAVTFKNPSCSPS